MINKGSSRMKNSQHRLRSTAVSKPYPLLMSMDSPGVRPMWPLTAATLSGLNISHVSAGQLRVESLHGTAIHCELNPPIGVDPAQ